MRNSLIKQIIKNNPFLLPLSCGFIVVIISALFYFFRLDESIYSKVEKAYIERTSVLINSIESTIKSGRRGGGLYHLGFLVDEMSKENHVQFIAITSKDGFIVMHSNPLYIGEYIDELGILQFPLGELKANENTKHRLLEVSDSKSFLVYKSFSIPTLKKELQTQKIVILIGINPVQLELAKQADTNYKYRFYILSLISILFILVTSYFIGRSNYLNLERKKAELKLADLETIHKEKLSAINKLAAGVAHEIRNPLSSIKGYTTLFKERLKSDEEYVSLADIMVHEVERLNTAVTSLIELTKPLSLKYTKVKIEELVSSCVTLLKINASNINIEINVENNLEFKLDENKIRQVLINLILNAIEAIHDNGKINITAYIENKNLIISVKDNGIGIDSTTATKIFDPYFTTKGNGTGLGLATVYNIIAAHQGTIELASKKSMAELPSQSQVKDNDGTEFIIKIPELINV